MKGGRTAPRNFLRLHCFAKSGHTSMKGGRTAPRNYADPDTTAWDYQLQ